MPLPRPPVPRLPRSAFVVGLLLLTLALTGVLAYQAQDAAHQHRAAAESAVRDYAIFTGEEYKSRLSEVLKDWTIKKKLGVVLNTDDTLDEPPQDLLFRALKRGAHGEVATGPLFAVDLGTGEAWSPKAPLSEEVRRWVMDSLPLHARTHYDPKVGFATAFTGWDRGTGMLTYALKTRVDGRSRVAYAFTVEPDVLAATFRSLYQEPLLPEALTGKLPNDSLVSMEVRAAGVPLFTSGHPYDPVLGAEAEIPPGLGPMTVRSTIRPDAVAMLVIGGLPRSRLPLLLGLLLVTTGLVVAAIHQLRREYELARLRSQFVSSVSHELRTPLAQIRMFGETLLLGRVRSEEEGRRSLEIIDQEARRLSHLVDNVLRFSRSERRKNRVDPRDVEVDCLVREVVEGFAPLAAASGVRVRADGGEGLVARVDPEALRQVLLNLLDNAVKYGPHGQTVRVGVDSEGGWLRLRVDDEGPGIPPRDREQVWEAFWRLEREDQSAVAGTGIGLAVVREIVELHGGRARIESSPAGGARVVVELPGARRVAQVPPPVPAAVGEEVA